MAKGSGIGGFGSGPSSINGGRGQKLTVTLEGMAALRARFKIFKAGIAVTGTQALPYAICEDIAEAAEDLAPFDPTNTTEPHVRDNINVRSIPGGAEVYVNRGGVRDEVPAYLELGTYKMAARPFLKPAGRMVFESGGIRRASRGVGGLLSPRGIRFEG